jgi:large repetitive protein
VNLTFGFGINGVKAFDQNRILVYGEYGLVPAILLSTNGGNSFKLIFHSQFDPMTLRTGITDMTFLPNGTTGFAVDADRILKTTDGGASWTVNWVDAGSFFDAVQGLDAFTVFAYSTRFGSSKLLKTTTTGGSWQRLDLPSGETISAASFLTPGKGWLNTKNNSDGGRTYYTSNGGTSWTLKNNPAVASFRTERMRFLDDSTGYALAGFTVYKTTDSGRIWERLPRDNSFSYLGYTHNDLHFWSSTQLWAGGGHGFLETSNNGGTPVPGAYFQVDTTGYLNSGTVKLTNYSKPNHSFRWLVNGAEIGTSYHASYTHEPFHLTDTVQLIAHNGVAADTQVQYRYFYPPVIVSSFSPTTAAGGVTVMIKGLHFTGATSVSFGGAPASFTVLSDTTIRATVGAGASGSVRVETPTGRGSLAGFTFIPPPVLTSFTPTAAIAGTTVTIYGQNFIDVTSVSFGVVPAASFTVVSPTILTAVVGVGTTGSISVTAVGGRASLDGFVALPNITSFTPTSGTFGTYMTITASGFGTTTAVSVGGTPVASFTVNSHTSITAVLSSGSAGDVTVTTPGGSSSKATLNYYEPPVVSAFSPLSGPVGTTVTIQGTNFDPVPTANAVYFGAVQATVLSGTATSLVVTVPAGATFQPVSVTAHNLTAFAAQPFVVTFANGSAITPMSFPNRYELNTGEGFTAVDGDVGDIDGDGKPDLLVINRGSYVSQTAVSVFRNTSAGNTLSFAPKVDYLVPDPGGLVVADIDGDGKLDFAVTDGDTYKIALFRNTSTPGSISFEPRVDLTTARMSGKIDMKDIDGDGKPDLVTSSWWEGQLVVHRNISNPGVLAFGPRINIQGPSMRNVVLQDMDRDGKPELIDMGRISKNNSTRGNIAFAAPVTYPNYTHSFITVGDVDNDGLTDIVTSDQNGSKVVVFRSTGNGLIVAPPVEYHATAGPAGIQLSDLDGDGKLDIATSLYDYSLAAFKNASTPGVIEFSPKVAYATQPLSTDNKVVLADLNGDGKPDPIVFAEMRRSVSIFLNNVKPEPFIRSFSPTIGSAGTTLTLRGANFTGTTGITVGGTPVTSFTVVSDTLLTVTIANGGTGDVAVTNNSGTGTRPGFVFGFPPLVTNFAPAAATVGSSLIITGDHFGSTPQDNIVHFGPVQATVTAATSSSLTVTVPTGALYRPISVTVNGLTGYSPQPFTTTFLGAMANFSSGSFKDTIRLANQTGLGAIGDMDGDGKVDLITVSGSNTVGVSINTSADDKITFGAKQLLTTGSNPFSISTGDVDGDGKQDIIVAHNTATFVSVFRNQSTIGNLSFAARVELPTGYAASGYGPVVRDLDKNGKPEIIVAGYDPRTITVFKNQSTPGNVSFAQRLDYLLDGYAMDIKAEDLNGDGLPELIAATNCYSRVAVFRNTSVHGTLSFALREDITVDEWPTSLTVGDLDGDGKPDVVVASRNGNNISILKNTGAGAIVSFTKTVQPVQYHPWSVWVNDMDGDGITDLCVQRELDDYMNTNMRSVDLYKNNSTPGTISFLQPANFPIGDYSIRSTSGDLDGDGRPEMPVFNSFLNNSSALLILRNRVGAAATVSVCEGGEATMPANLTGTTYQWQQNTGAGFVNVTNSDNVSGPTTASLRVSNAPVAWNGYQYRCIAGTDTCALFILQVNALPVADAGADKGICAGGNGTFIGGATLNGNTYSWSPATGLGSTTVAATYATPTATTQYILTVTSTAGCTKKDTVVVTVGQPPTPTITAGGATQFCAGGNVQLSSSAMAGNQWYQDGTAISGTTAPMLSAEKSGVYTARASNGTCTSPFSNAITVFTFPGVIAGPNPVTDKLLIQYPNNTERLSVMLMDMNGQSVLEGIFVTSYQIDMRLYQPGSYILQIINERTGERERRIIVKL